MSSTRTNVTLDGAGTSSGMATTYEGRTFGHVHVYMAGSSLTIDGSDPQPFRQLAASLVEAADEIEATRQVVA